MPTARRRWEHEHVLRLLFFACPASVLPAASKAAGGCLSCFVRFRPQRQGWDQSLLFGEFAVHGACFGFPSPKAKAAIFRRFHAESTGIDCSINAFVHKIVRRVASSAHSWVSNPSRYPAVYARGGSISQRRPSSSVRGSGAALFAAAPASSVSRRRSRRRPLSCFARRLYFAAAP